MQFLFTLQRLAFMTRHQFFPACPPFVNTVYALSIFRNFMLLASSDNGKPMLMTQKMSTRIRSSLVSRTLKGKLKTFRVSGSSSYQGRFYRQFTMKILIVYWYFSTSVYSRGHIYLISSEILLCIFMITPVNDCQIHGVFVALIKKQ